MSVSYPTLKTHSISLCALRCVRSNYLSLCHNGKFDPCKYKTVKHIEKPAGIYHYVAESSRVVVQNFTEIGSPILGGQIGEVFF